MKNTKMTYKVAKFTLLLSSLIASHTVFASTQGTNGIPVDKNGDTIPTPTGSIPFFRMPNALAADHGEYTWDYCGTLDNPTHRFSFQATLMQLSRSGKAGIGLHQFGFAFKKDGAWFYSNSTYGGEKQIDQAVAQSIDSITSSASLNHFNLSEISVLDPHGQWKVISTSKKPLPPLYKGWVGQPGHDYKMTGTGTTFLWRYNTTTGAKSVQPYTYTFTVNMEDTRGAVMEGLGGGYVGPALITNEASSKSVNVESEIAQPRLRVLNWQMQFQAIGKSAIGFNKTYTFSGNNGMLWDDFGPVDKSIASGGTSKNQLFSALIQRNAPNATSTDAAKYTAVKGLYNGNWFPVQFTKGKYAGASIVFTAFWTPGAGFTIGQSTDDIGMSKVGWTNFYAGLIPNEPDSAFSMVSSLYPENPELPSINTTHRPPYKIVLDSYTPAKYDLAASWVQHITITVRANTALRYALAAYADRLANNNNADDPSQNLVIHIAAISPVTQDTMFSKNITQYYEGAGIPTINGKVVGYAWVEHMRN